MRAEAAEGFRWLRDHHILGPLTVSQVVYYFGVATSLSLLVYFVTDELDASDRTFGFVLAIGAVGAFLGTLVGGPVAERIGERITLSGAVVLQAVTLGLSALADSVVVLAVLWFFNGLPAGAQRPVARSLQQRLTPNTLLGRVNVSNRIFTRGIIVIGALLAGTIAQLSGIRASFALAGGVQMLAAALMWRALGRRTSARPTAG